MAKKSAKHEETTEDTATKVADDAVGVAASEVGGPMAGKLVSDVADPLIHEGEQEIESMVGQYPPRCGGFLYSTCYYLAYGLVFPVAFVAARIPTENALVYGLVDGSRAARDAAAQGTMVVAPA